MRNSVKKAVIIGATLLVVGGAGSGIAVADTTTAPAPTPPAAGAHQKHPGQHGEFVRHGNKGDKTIDYQRGRVSALTPTTVTVTSRDGFAGTYTFGPKVKVTKGKQPSATNQIEVGDRVGLAAVTGPAGLQAVRVHDAGAKPPKPAKPATPAPAPAPGN